MLPPQQHLSSLPSPLGGAAIVVGTSDDSDEDDAGGDGIVLEAIEPVQLEPAAAATAVGFLNEEEMHDAAPAPPASEVMATPPRHAMELRQRRQSRTTLIREDGGDVVMEEWALLDPHEAAVPLRPFKKGKTFRVPRCLLHPDVPKAAVKAEENGATVVRLRAPFFEEFDELYEAEMKRRRAMLAARRKPIVVNIVGQKDKPILLNRVEPDTEAFFDQPYAILAEGAAGLQDDAPAPLDDVDDDDDADDHGDPLGAFGDVQPSVVTAADDGECSTAIADTIRMLADDSQRIAERHRQEENLVARIAEWHNRLQPILETQEARRGFDIQECATELLEQMEGDAEGGDDHTVGFGKLVNGREPWEICRYFLSSLLLINCGNVEVSATAPLQFKIKTTEKRFDACGAFETRQHHTAPMTAKSDADKEAEEKDDDDREEDDEATPAVAVEKPTKRKLKARDTQEGKRKKSV
jgi:hypothetical protein